MLANAVRSLASRQVVASVRRIHAFAGGVRAEGNVKAIDSLDDYEKETASAGGVVVDFSATWCAPCRQIAPIYEKLSVEHPDVKFLKVDIDQAPDIASKEGIQSVPTFLFFKDNKRAAGFSGANRQRLLESITSIKAVPK
eukprot:c34258_g1_i1.p1 GENE.c34258_g1_i1~~c34258_g1_i1.p1  ORF type:complete len:140 (-),score=34.75 c34258_g1_i1:19-438(-)